MPINDPIRRSKVAPASLAFENRREGATIVGGDGTTGNVTYQTFVTNQYRFGSSITVNVRAAEDTTRATMAAMANAERRAKHHASDWHYAFEWDSGSTSYSWQSTSTLLGFQNILKLPNEIVRTIHGTNVDDKWAFAPNADACGTWLVSAMIAFRMTPEHKIEEARLAVLKNGALYRFVDITNTHHTDRNSLEELVMQGTALVPLAFGDSVQLAVYLKDNTGTGGGTLAADTQYYAYVNGARVRCASDTITTAKTGGDFDNSI
jgi:hypothetical protein